jgi:hypothetical protein
LSTNQVPRYLFETAIIQRKQIKTNYEEQFKINQMLKYEITTKRQKDSIKRKKIGDEF